MLIGEVSERSGVSARMLRHYDRLGLLTPTGRTSGGYREYAPADIARLFHIESLRSLGLTLAEVGAALDDPAFSPAGLVDDLIVRTRERIAADTALLSRLEQVDDASPDTWSGVVDVVTMLHALTSSSTGHKQRIALTAGTSTPIDAVAEALLAEDDPNVAGALRWSLARAGEAALPALSPSLDDPDADVRRRALAAIAEIALAEPTNEAAALPLLTGALDDPDDTVRDRAALTVTTCGDPSAIPHLIAMIVEGRRDVEAAETLGRLIIRQPGTATSILTAFDAELTHADQPAALRVTQALAELPPDTALDMLTRLTTDADRAIAATASSIIAQTGGRNP